MSLLASEKLPNVNKERWEVSLRSIPRRMGRLTEADPEDERRQTIEKMFTGICSQYQEVLTAKQPTKYITGDQSKYGKGKPQRINPSWQRWHATQKQTGDFAAATETVMFGQREGLSCRVNGQTRDYSLLEADPKAQRLATSIELGFTASDVVLLYKPGVIELVHRELIPGTTEQLDKRLLVVENDPAESKNN